MYRSLGRSQRAPDKRSPLPWIVGVLLVALAALPAPASAGRLASAAGSVKGTVESTVPPAPVPGPPPASTPRLPVRPPPAATPAAPRGDPAPDLPSQTAVPSPPASGTGGSSSPAGGVEGVVGTAADTARAARTSAAALAGASARGGRAQLSTPPVRTGTGGRGVGPGESVGGSTRPFAVAAAGIAAAERWLAHVWPGVPLSSLPDQTLAIGGVAVGLLRPTAGAARLLVLAAPLAELARDRAPVDGPQPQPSSDPRLSLFGASVSAAWKEVLFLVALALFAGAMTFTFWREKGPAPRIRLR
jgi:hypothetical protein